jgi:hypothetical protein
LAFIGTSNGLLYVGRFVENTQGSEVTTNLTRRWKPCRLNLTALRTQYGGPRWAIPRADIFESAWKTYQLS